MTPDTVAPCKACEGVSSYHTNFKNYFMNVVVLEAARYTKHDQMTHSNGLLSKQL